VVLVLVAGSIDEALFLSWETQNKRLDGQQ
jgi:hypothetical protein